MSMLKGMKERIEGNACGDDGWVAGWVEEQTNTWPRCQHLTLLPISQSILIYLLHMLHLHV